MALFAGGPSLRMRAIQICGLALLSLALVALSGSPASATIYKWFDNDGNVGFTDDISKVPAAYRDSATSMSEAQLARRVYIHKEMPLDLDPIVIPGHLQTGKVIRGKQGRFAPRRYYRGFKETSERSAYVPNLGYLQEAGSHGPSEHTGAERTVYINGDRFFLRNPLPVETEVNWADKEVLERVYGPEVRKPELDLYVGGHP